jgi:Catalytic LigB subunit of aromatic ring-opening dioxygenase
MLASQREDWQHGFRTVDVRNTHYFDKHGNKTDYAALLASAPADAESRVTPERMGERFDEVDAAMNSLRDRIKAARLDVLLIVGDDQNELFQTTNLPAVAIYYGATIRDAKRTVKPADTWYTRARMARQEPDSDFDYPVDSDMAKWLIRSLCDRDFDITAMDGLSEGQFEGHAFSFIHRRYLNGLHLPVIPVIVNKFDPPNQPTRKRCLKLGIAIRELIAAYPKDLRVGVLASGGLSHFVVDEDLDRGIIGALKTKNSEWFAALDPKQLQAGSSEIRNWIIVSEVARDLAFDWVSYTPGYRSPALSGTGLAFAAWEVL